jgi:succinate dehydrogenase/fumarate reductase flavoprotein subunit
VELLPIDKVETDEQNLTQTPGDPTMRNSLSSSIVAGIMATFLVAACANEGEDAQLTNPAETEQSNSIMDQPVDFSTPENVEKSIQKVCQQESETACKKLDSAMQYILVYDLSIGNNKEKMYKKLDGKTPNAIIAKMKR